MLLNPFDTTLENGEIPQEITQIFEASGLVPKLDDSKLPNARKIFNKKGASLEAAAQTISNVMQRGESDAVKLKASEMAMRVHGVLENLDVKSMPEININISGSSGKTLINLVLPN
jgi:hypothetical protein